MSFRKNVDRQCPTVGYVDVAFSDLTSGQPLDVIELPGGAIITGGSVSVLTAFNSGTDDAISIGDAGNLTRYLGDGELHTTGHVPLVPTGHECQTNTSLTAKWTGSGAPPSAGKFRLTVTYFVTNRSEFTQG